MMSQTHPQEKKRDIADFFKPHGRTTTSIPQKRPSPSGTSNDDRPPTRKAAPKTPAKSVKFKDVTPKSAGTPFFSPHSQSSLPIRSPGPHHTLSPSINRQITLFEKKTSPPRHTKPITSFTFSDISDRSQKVVEYGKVVAVRDSDDDTDSLESLEDIFGRRRAAAATAANLSDSSPPEDTEAERVKTLSLFTSGRSVPIVGKDKLRALYAKERATKFDLSAVLDDHFGDEEAEQNISKMRAGFDGAKDSDEDDHLDKDLLAAVVQGGDADQEDLERLLNAVERTEALSTEKRFSFFKVDACSKGPLPRKDVFPQTAIPDQMWVSKDTHSQDRAYLSGYMAELALGSYLADEALRWTFNQVVKESQANLRQAYIQCLKASSNSWTRSNITATDVQTLFQTLGADGDSLRDGSLIKTKYQPIQDQQKQDYNNTVSVLELFQTVCQDMDFLALSKLSSIILRLTLDNSAMSNNHICVAAEGLLETLLSLPDEEARSHVYDRLISDITEHLHDPSLQVQLLGHILPTSPEAIKLRKTLAHAFLLGPSTVDPDTNKVDSTLDDLSSYISTSPSFSLTRHATSAAIDYSALTARIQILNVAVSSGSPPPETTALDTSLSKTMMTKITTEHLRFNDSVDDLADKLHNLFVAIKDTGASHMRRTEAKDALQALYFRLLFSVRTKVRKKRHVFDSNGDMKGGNSKGRWISGEEWREKERGGDFMKRFLAKREIKGV